MPDLQRICYRLLNFFRRITVIFMILKANFDLENANNNFNSNEQII